MNLNKPEEPIYGEVDGLADEGDFDLLGNTEL